MREFTLLLTGVAHVGHVCVGGENMMGKCEIVMAALDEHQSIMHASFACSRVVIIMGTQDLT